MAIIITGVLIFCFTACSQNSGATQQSTIESNSAPNTTADINSEENTSKAESKILVAYFSATNTTEKVANYIAESLNSDIYEIIPENPYTFEDLDYDDSNSRTTIEMNDASVRPAISGSVDNMEQYDVVLIGYPIWWGDAPRIINTFLESYDFSNKTIVPFCTSGGSAIGTSVSHLKSITSNAQWYDGERFSSSTTHSDVDAWINRLNL